MKSNQKYPTIAIILKTRNRTPKLLSLNRFTLELNAKLSYPLKTFEKKKEKKIGELSCGLCYCLQFSHGFRLEVWTVNYVVHVFFKPGTIGS
jgi:hypothetical protein